MESWIKKTLVAALVTCCSVPTAFAYTIYVSNDRSGPTPARYRAQ